MEGALFLLIVLIIVHGRGKEKSRPIVVKLHHTAVEAKPEAIAAAWNNEERGQHETRK